MVDTKRFLTSGEVASLGKDFLTEFNYNYNRRGYYDCFNSYYKTGSPEEMLAMIAKYMEEILD